MQPLYMPDTKPCRFPHMPNARMVRRGPVINPLAFAAAFAHRVNQLPAQCNPRPSDRSPTSASTDGPLGETAHSRLHDRLDGVPNRSKLGLGGKACRPSSRNTSATTSKPATTKAPTIVCNPGSASVGNTFAGLTLGNSQRPKRFAPPGQINPGRLVAVLHHLHGPHRHVRSWPHRAGGQHRTGA